MSEAENKYKLIDICKLDKQTVIKLLKLKTTRL